MSTILKKIGEYSYMVSGTITYRDHENETIERNGKIYTSTSYNTKVYNCDEEFEKCEFVYSEFHEEYKSANGWLGEIFDFKWLGIPQIVIYAPDIFCNDAIAKSITISYSENVYVRKLAWIFSAHKLGDFDVIPHGIITSSYTAKKATISDFEHLSIPINICDYGFNNSFYIEVPIINILKFDFKTLPLYVQGQIKYLFEKNKRAIECGYKQWNVFFKNIVPIQYFERQLTEIELVDVLNKLNAKKAKIFSEANRRSKDKCIVNDYIINQLN